MMSPPRIAAVSTVCAFGRGIAALRDGVLAGRPAFVPVDRFNTDKRRVRLAATLPGASGLRDELIGVISEVCAHARLSEAERREMPMLLAIHAHPDAARGSAGLSAGQFARSVAIACGLDGAARVYTSACVAGTTAIADAGGMVTRGGAKRVLVAAGYLVESDQFALFDAGRALALDGAVRPFSMSRQGILLGDAVSAMIVESSHTPSRAPAYALLHGWGRAGDAYHAVQPRPDGSGLARAIESALRRSGLTRSSIGYVNAHGTGTAQSDASESAALHKAFGSGIGDVLVSSTKSTHGHALEASGLLEMSAAMASLRAGVAPVNAGYLGADPECGLNLALRPGTVLTSGYALNLNSAFGGANTAVLVGAP